MEVGELLVKLGLDKSNFNKGISEAKNDTNNFSSFLKGAFQFTVGQGIFDALKTGLKEAWDMSLGFNSVMQQNQIAFESMLGSADKAGNLMSQLADMAANTPFELPQLTDATKKMMAFGFSAAQIPEDLTKIGDAASGLGLGAEGVNRITIALGQMSAKGKVQAQEMMQLTETGIPAWDILAKAMNKSTAEVMKLSEKGLIPADAAIRQLLNGMEERFPNMMDKQSKSFQGLMSTLKDNTQMTLGDIMKPAFDDLTNNVLPALINKTQALRDAFKMNGMNGVLNELFPPALASTISTVGGLIKDVFNFTIDHGQMIGTVISGVVGGFVTYRGAILALSLAQEAQNLVTAVGIALSKDKAAADAFLAFTTTEAGTAVKGATAAQWLLNAAMDANPIMLVVGALGVLTGALLGYNLLVGSTASAQDSLNQNAINNINKEKDAQISALENQSKAQKDAVNTKMDSLDESHTAILDNIQEEYQAQVDGLQDQERALKDSLQKRKQILEDQHNDAVQKIRDYYGVASETSHSLTDVVKDDAEQQKKALEDAYNAATKKLEDETNAQIDAVNAQIKAIDDKAKQEDRADQDAKDNQQLRLLKVKEENAKSVTEKAVIQTQIANLEKEINKRKDEELGEARKTELQNQIDQLKKNEDDKKTILQTNLDKEKEAIDKATQSKIDKIQEERKAKEAAESAKYNSAKDALDKEEASLDGWSKNQKKILDANLKAKQDTENAKYKAAKAALDAELQAVVDTEQKKRQEIEKTARDSQQAASNSKSAWGTLIDLGFNFAGMSSNADSNSDFFGSKVLRWAVKKITGYATGTDYATPGLHWVGENGPELVNFKGGEAVHNASDSKEISSSKPNIIQVFLDGNMIHQHYDYAQGRNIKLEARRVGI